MKLKIVVNMNWININNRIKQLEDQLENPELLIDPQKVEIKLETYREILSNELFLDNTNNWNLYRICEHCNKEYELDRQHEDGETLINNFQYCPNCGERDDAWVRLQKKPRI